MRLIYKEFQFGWIIFGFVVPAQVLINYLYFAEVGNKPISVNSIVFANFLLCAIYLLFYGLHTQLTHEVLSVAFGIGIIKKRIPIRRIANVKEIKSNVLYGWGLRFIPNGMMYNISGFDTVELKFTDSKRIFRIGTQNPGRLKEEIQKAIDSSAQHSHEK